MNFQFYVEKLFAGDEFKKFIEENKEAYPCSAFFVIDKQGKDNKQHFDYYISSVKKMFSFKLEDNCAKVPVEIVDASMLKKENQIVMNYDFDFDRIEKIIEGELFEKKIKNKIQKLLFSMQRRQGKDFLLGTIFLSNMALLSVSIDLSEMKIVSFEKKSFFDMLKITKKEEKH